MLNSIHECTVTALAKTSIRIACVQMEPRVGFKDNNLTNLNRKIAQAAENGADIVVAPELCNSGLRFRIA